MIFLIVFLLPQNSFLQEISGENFSSIYLFLDNYFGELKDIEKINIKSVLDQTRKLKNEQHKKSEIQIITLANNDQKILI